MNEVFEKSPLDSDVAAAERGMKESGIPDLFEGGDGPTCRERGHIFRAKFYPKPDLPKGRIENRTIPGPGGDIAIRITWPHEGAAKGTVVYYHGGGWIVGDLDSHEMHAVRIANRVGVVVVNVDYRLAPEHRFPSAVDDAFAALQWAAAHRAELGGEGGALAVGGDSAGGNIAAAVAWMARDAGLKLHAQLLLYAATNLSGERHDGPGAIYLGDRFAQVKFDPRASPVLADLHGVAPAIVGVGPHDFLYRDNLAFVEALRAAGAEVRLRVFPSLGHSFFSYTGISKVCEAASNQMCDDLAEFMKR